MKKLRCSYWLSLISIVISVVSAVIVICTAGGNLFDLDIDSAALLVAVLAVLVTVLVGFQIYNAIQIKEQINMVEHNINVYQEDISERFDKFIDDYNLDIERMKNDTLGEWHAIYGIENMEIQPMAFVLACRALKYLTCGSGRNAAMIPEVENEILIRINKHNSGELKINLGDSFIDECCFLITNHYSNKKIAVQIKDALMIPLRPGEQRPPIKKY